MTAVENTTRGNLTADLRTSPAGRRMIKPKPSKNTKAQAARERLVSLGVRLIVPVLLVSAWYWLSQSPTSQLFVASPWDSLQRVFADYFSADAGRFFLGAATYEHLIPSLGRALIGLALAVVAGVGVGIVLGISPVISALFQPLIHLGRSIPSPALLGVFFLLFGTGDSPKIFLIAFGVVWPILFNTIDGVGSIGEQRLQAAAVFKIRRLDVLTKIILPGASPKIFAGVRTSLSLALIIMIISELQKSENGLGYLLVMTQRNFNYEGFWSILIVLAVLGVLMNILFQFVERRVIAWHRGATQQND